MAVGTNRWKLGLFVLVGIGLAIVAIVVLGARRWNERTVGLIAFFDESVQGLDPGSPVKFRGVTIGHVAAIEVAPDHRHVEVELDLSVGQLEHLDLAALQHPDRTFLARTKLRVQLAQTGITGVKFILLDFFDKPSPPEALPFPVPPNTIPTEPSTMKNLEDSLVRAAGQMPDIATALLGTITRLNTLLDDVSDQRLPEHASATLGKVDATLGDLRSQIQALNLAQLSGHADRDLAKLERTLDGVDKVLARLDGDDGLMQSAARATNSFNEVARGAQTVGPEMELTLKEVRGAARSIRRFADALERDPDMLLKGRATAGQ